MPLSGNSGHLFAVEVAKHLLRGRLGQVSSLRRIRTSEYNQLPPTVLRVANQWTGRGRGDAAGRTELDQFLKTLERQHCPR